MSFSDLTKKFDKHTEAVYTESMGVNMRWINFYFVVLTNGENIGFETKLEQLIFHQLWNLADMETKAYIGYEWGSKYTEKTYKNNWS